MISFYGVSYGIIPGSLLCLAAALRSTKQGLQPTIGFCWSFPLKQTALNRGILLDWTKGFTCDGKIRGSGSEVRGAGGGKGGEGGQTRGILLDWTKGFTSDGKVCAKGGGRGPWRGRTRGRLGEDLCAGWWGRGRKGGRGSVERSDMRHPAGLDQGLHLRR